MVKTKSRPQTLTMVVKTIVVRKSVVRKDVPVRVWPSPPNFFYRERGVRVTLLVWGEGLPFESDVLDHLIIIFYCAGIDKRSKSSPFHGGVTGSNPVAGTIL